MTRRGAFRAVRAPLGINRAPVRRARSLEISLDFRLFLRAIEIIGASHHQRLPLQATPTFTMGTEAR